MGEVEKVKLKRIGILKSALFMGIYGFFMGIISAILLLMIVSFLSSATSITPGMDAMSFSGFNFILFPLIYAVFGFIAGLILTPIMNLILKMIKGLNMDFEEASVPVNSN